MSMALGISKLRANPSRQIGIEEVFCLTTPPPDAIGFNVEWKDYWMKANENLEMSALALVRRSTTLAQVGLTTPCSRPASLRFSN